LVIWRADPDDILGKGSLVAVLESRGYRVEVYATRRQ